MQINFVMDNLCFAVWQHDNHIEIAALDVNDDMFASKYLPETASAIELITEVQKIKDKYDVHLYKLEKERLQNMEASTDDIPF